MLLMVVEKRVVMSRLVIFVGRCVVMKCGSMWLLILGVVVVVFVSVLSLVCKGVFVCMCMKSVVLRKKKSREIGM